MKILQINSVCGIGSTGRIATDIHQLLVKSGHESVIAYGRGEAKSCDHTIKIGNNFDILLHVFKTRFFDLHGFGSKRATKKFVQTVLQLDPDLIHLHNLHGYYLNIEILFEYLRRAKKPVVWTLHDCWPFTGHSAFIEEGKESAPLKGRESVHEYPKSYFIDNSKRNYQNKKRIFTGLENVTVVTPSEWLKTLVKKSFLKEYEVKVIRNGVDLNIFKPVPGNFRSRYGIENKFVILGVANVWEERKGLKYFFELSKRISRDEMIVLVGLSDKQMKNLPGNIIGIRKTNDIHELVQIYTAADVFVNPTLEDNFPTTNIEALACGTPVVTFDTGGCGEIVAEDCGRVVPKGDLEKLFDAVQNIKEQGKNVFTGNCIVRAQRNFNKNDRYKEYIQLYGEKLK